MTPTGDNTCLPTPIRAKSKRPRGIVPRFLRTESNANFSSSFQPRIAFYFHHNASQRNLTIALTLRQSHLKANVLLLTSNDTNVINYPQTKTGIINLQEKNLLATLSSFKPDIFIVEQCQLNELQKTLEQLKRSSTQCVLSISDAPQPNAQSTTQDDLIKRYIDEIWLYSDAQVCNLAKAHRLPKQAVQKTRYTGYLNPHKTTLPATANHPGDETTWVVLKECNDFTKAIEFSLTIANNNDIGLGLILGPSIPALIKQNLRDMIATTRGNITLKDYDSERFPTLKTSKNIIVFGNKTTIIEMLSYQKNTLIISQKNIAPFHQIKRFNKIKNTDVLPIIRTKTALVFNWITSVSTKNKNKTLPHIDAEGLVKLPTFVGKLLTNERRKTQRHTAAQKKTENSLC